MTKLRSAVQSAVLGGCVALVASISACGGQTNHGGEGHGSCPANLPGAGTTCAGSADCSYPRCQSSGEPDQVARCIDGSWQLSLGKTCPSACPGAFPEDGAVCSVPSGLVCKYPQACCTDNQAACVNGHWQAQEIFCGAPQPEPCPMQAPLSGSSCVPSNPCGGVPQYCTYGDCGGGSPSTIATCDGWVWQVQKQTCAAPCETLSACECFHRSDCEAQSDGCICECDYQCAGDPPCMCACGGGKYLGCVPLMN